MLSSNLEGSLFCINSALFKVLLSADNEKSYLLKTSRHELNIPCNFEDKLYQSLNPLAYKVH